MSVGNIDMMMMMMMIPTQTGHGERTRGIQWNPVEQGLPKQWALKKMDMYEFAPLLGTALFGFVWKFRGKFETPWFIILPTEWLVVPSDSKCVSPVADTPDGFIFVLSSSVSNIHFTLAMLCIICNHIV